MTDETPTPEATTDQPAQDETSKLRSAFIECAKERWTEIAPGETRDDAKLVGLVDYHMPEILREVRDPENLLRKDGNLRKPSADKFVRETKGESGVWQAFKKVNATTADDDDPVEQTQTAAVDDNDPTQLGVAGEEAGTAANDNGGTGPDLKKIVDANGGGLPSVDDWEDELAKRIYGGALKDFHDVDTLTLYMLGFLRPGYLNLPAFQAALQEKEDKEKQARRSFTFFPLSSGLNAHDLVSVKYDTATQALSFKDTAGNIFTDNIQGVYLHKQKPDADPTFDDALNLMQIYVSGRVEKRENGEPQTMKFELHTGAEPSMLGRLVPGNPSEKYTARLTMLILSALCEADEGGVIPNLIEDRGGILGKKPMKEIWHGHLDKTVLTQAEERFGKEHIHALISAYNQRQLKQTFGVTGEAPTKAAAKETPVPADPVPA